MVFYYQIHPPGPKQKNWLNTHAPLLRAIFRRLDDWQPSSRGQLPDYSDIDKFSKIKNSLKYRENIAAKSYLARKLKDRTDIFPPTVILSSEGIEPTSKRAQWLFERNQTSKYYLKPENGFAGQGISIIARPQEALKIAEAQNARIGNSTKVGKLVVKTRRLRQFSTSAAPKTRTTNILNRGLATPKTYILQQTIPRIHLYPGDRKYEYRIWICVAWQKKQTQNRLRFYFYQDAVMRLTAQAYNSKSLKAEGNITTSSYYYQDQGVYKSDLLSRQPYFQSVFPQAQAIAKEIVRLIRPEMIIQGDQGFEIFGFDFLNQYYTPEGAETRLIRPVVIEINRHIGYYTYPPGVHAPWVTEANMTMMSDLIELVMVPMLENRPLPESQGLWQQVLEV